MRYEGSLVFLSVSDLQRSSVFYRSLGLEMLVDQGSCHILGDGGTMMLGICGPREPSPDGVIVTLVTSEVERVCSDLEAAGIVFEQRPRFNPEYAITHALLRDPDGYLVEIQHFDT